MRATATKNVRPPCTGVSSAFFRCLAASSAQPLRTAALAPLSCWKTKPLGTPWVRSMSFRLETSASSLRSSSVTSLSPRSRLASERSGGPPWPL